MGLGITVEVTITGRFSAVLVVTGPVILTALICALVLLPAMVAILSLFQALVARVAALPNGPLASWHSVSVGRGRFHAVKRPGHVPAPTSLSNQWHLLEPPRS